MSTLSSQKYKSVKPVSQGDVLSGLSEKMMALSQHYEHMVTSEIQRETDLTKKNCNVDIPYRCTVESVSHSKFAKIMNLDNISYGDVIQSLDVIKNKSKVFQAGEGAGASGSFFFFSQDYRFIIKTLRGNEIDALVGMLDEYVEHLESTNNQSLLARIYGIFKVKTPFFSQLEVIVMQNTSRYFNPK